MKKMKKILSVILCVVLLVLSFSTTSFAEGEGADDFVLVGDVDGNGKIETVDARLVLRVAANIDSLSADKIEAADANFDGVISLDDALVILKAAANIAVDGGSGGTNKPEEPDNSGGDNSGSGDTSGIVIPDKNGDNFLSDSRDNEFIKLISSKYNLDPASLVAIYSVPDSGTNYVLRFGGNSKNGYKKSADNLKYVYHIGAAPERKISYTNGKTLIGADHYNCTAAEGIMVFNLVKTKVMEQYPDYFVK